MAQQPPLPAPNYILDYNAAEGIVITGPNGIREVLPIIPPLGADSPFTPFTYKAASPHLDIDPQHINDATFTYAQILVRIWDMMKDGSPSMNEKIKQLMGKGNPIMDFSHFAEMRSALVRVPHIAAKITKSSWIKPNTYETEHSKLHSRLAYQESGLSPSIIITNPTYVVNLANTVIDPFTRDFSGAVPKLFFPGTGNCVKITSDFFDFMGFSECELTDYQVTNNMPNNLDEAHAYELKVSGSTIIKKKNYIPLPYQHAKGWYAGNKTKNKDKSHY